MRKIIYLSAVLLAFISCTKKLQLPVEPEVTQGISAITISIPSIQIIDDATSGVIPGNGTHRWSLTENLGILSEDGRNARFILRKKFDGNASEDAEFYGEPLYGTLTGYLPWNEDPSAVDRTEQDYYPDAYAHFMNNALLKGTVTDSHLSMEYSGGLLKISCNQNLGLVESARIYTNGWEAAVVGIDSPCSPSSPLTIWVRIPVGKYSNFNVTYNCTGKKLSIPAPGEFTVENLHCVDVKVEQKSYYDGIDPFTGEGAEYSDKPEDY